MDRAHRRGAQGRRGQGQVTARSPRVVVDRALEIGARAHFDDAAYYTQTYAPRRDDVAFYEQLVGDAAVLEYGVGNGRIALPLARNGAQVTGVDWSQPMLADLAERLAREPADVRRRVRAVHGDMRAARVRRRFPLVICTFNTFLHLYTRSDVERFLARVRAHMEPGARFVFDVSLPQPEDLARDPDRSYAAPRLRHPSSGQMVKYRERFDYDAARQILFVTIEFSPVDGSPPWVVPLAHRQFFPQELEALLHYAGFTVDEVHGGFAREPLSRHTDVAVYWCR